MYVPPPPRVYDDSDLMLQFESRRYNEGEESLQTLGFVQGGAAVRSACSDLCTVGKQWVSAMYVALHYVCVCVCVCGQVVLSTVRWTLDHVSILD